MSAGAEARIPSPNLAQGLDLSSGAAEGFNAKAKLRTRRAYVFRTVRAIKVTLYYALGNLPGLQATHRFR